MEYPPIFSNTNIHSVLIPVLAFISVGFLLKSFLDIKRKQANLPPGPPGHWLLGNVFPKSFAYREYERYTQEYGPVFSLHQGIFGNVTIIIGRVNAVVDIMEKEGAATADRPVNISVGETLSGGMRMLLTGSGDRLRKMRKAMHIHMQQRVAVNYTPIQQRDAKRMILDIIEDPAHHQEHAKRYAAAVVMTITYGTSVNTYRDASVQAVIRVVDRIGNNLRPGLWKVEKYPWLRYVPGYLRELQEGHKEELALFQGEMNTVRQRMKTNSAPPSFGRYLIENQQETGLNNNETAYLAGSMFGAGSDTSASAISITILAAVTHPEAQARVQEELDQVVGRDRAPTFSDEAMLPQAAAFILESFRWRPVSPGGFAHRATKDIYWKNYVIPQGAAVIGNTWSISRDPEVFPNPETFNPQRWIDKDGQLRTDMRLFGFGFGRRVCPGQHIASRSVFINHVLTHWAFKMEANGPIDTLAFTAGATTHPMPFGVVFKPRIEVEKIKEMLEGFENDPYA